MGKPNMYEFIYITTYKVQKIIFVVSFCYTVSSLSTLFLENRIVKKCSYHIAGQFISVKIGVLSMQIKICIKNC